MMRGTGADSTISPFPRTIKRFLQLADFLDNMVPTFATDQLRTLYEHPGLDGAAVPASAVERYRFCVYCLGLAPDEKSALPMRCLGMSAVDPTNRRYALRLTEEFELITRIEAGQGEVRAVIEQIQRVRPADE
jgi:hypothetical protein